MSDIHESYGSYPTTCVYSGIYSRHRNGESSSSSRSDRDRDYHSDKDSDSGRWVSTQARPSWQNAEHNGFSATPSGYPVGNSAPKSQYQLDKSNEPYPPRPFKDGEPGAGRSLSDIDDCHVRSGGMGGLKKRSSLEITLVDVQPLEKPPGAFLQKKDDVDLYSCGTKSGPKILEHSAGFLKEKTVGNFNQCFSSSVLGNISGSTSSVNVRETSLGNVQQSPELPSENMSHVQPSYHDHHLETYTAQLHSRMRSNPILNHHSNRQVSSSIAHQPSHQANVGAAAYDDSSHHSILHQMKMPCIHSPHMKQNFVPASHHINQLSGPVQEINSDLISALPDDMLDLICQRLPVKSVVRFTAVSKYWLKRVSDQFFIKGHFEKRNNIGLVILTRHRPLFEPRREGDDILTFHDLKPLELNELRPHLNIPFTIRDGPVYSPRLILLGPSKGLICIHYAENHFMICNLSLREFLELPLCPGNKENYGVLGEGFGFCGDVLQIVVIRRLSDDSGRTVVNIFNSRTNLWTEDLVEFSRNGFHLLPESGVLLGGNIYWNASSDHLNRESTRFILCFGMSSQIFSEIQFPEAVSYVIHLTIMDGCLGFVELCPKTVQHFRTITMWVMDMFGSEFSWRKRFSIQIMEGARPLHWDDGAGFGIMDHISGLQTFQFRPWVNAFNHVTLPNEELCTRVLTYEESLIQLKDVICSSSFVKEDDEGGNGLVNAEDDI